MFASYQKAAVAESISGDTFATGGKIYAPMRMCIHYRHKNRRKGVVRRKWQRLYTMR